MWFIQHTHFLCHSSCFSFFFLYKLTPLSRRSVLVTAYLIGGKFSASANHRAVLRTGCTGSTNHSRDAPTGREKSSATFDGLLSLCTGVNKQQQQLLRRCYAAFTNTSPAGLLMKNWTQDTENSSRTESRVVFLSSHKTPRRVTAVSGLWCSCAAQLGPLSTGLRSGFRRRPQAANSVLEQQQEPPR